jgi:uncharacterized membrane protein
MTDIVTGILGMVIMTTFVFLVMTKVYDPAIWVVSIATLLLMVIAFCQDTLFQHQRRTDLADVPPPPTV